MPPAQCQSDIVVDQLIAHINRIVLNEVALFLVEAYFFVNQRCCESC